MKRFAVNICRTITVQQTVYIDARNEEAAEQGVDMQISDGKGGHPKVEWGEASGVFDGNIDTHSEEEDIVIESIDEE